MSACGDAWVACVCCVGVGVHGRCGGVGVVCVYCVGVGVDGWVGGCVCVWVGVFFYLCVEVVVSAV